MNSRASEFAAEPGFPAGLETACTAAQRRVWLMDQLQPGNPALNRFARCGVVGDLPAALLDRALATLVARHESLRLYLTERHGLPVSNLATEARRAVRSIDLAALPESQAHAQADAAMAHEAQAGFDLSAAPLLRVLYVRLDSRRGQLALTTHQLTDDAGAAEDLLHEFMQICAELEQGGVPAPQAGAARRAPRSASAEDDAYWAAMLRALPPFELAPDHARPPIHSSRAALGLLPVSGDLVARLRDVSRREGCSLHATALATLVALLSRWTDQQDLVLGTTAEGAGSPRAGPLPLRANLAGRPVFGALLRQVRETLDSSLRHAAISLDRLLELRGPQRDLSRPALFPVHFLFKLSGPRARDYGPFQVEPLPPCCTGALYDLDFAMLEEDGAWTLACQYNTDLYEPQTAQRLLHHFGNLLQAVATDPGRPVSALPMLDPEEEYALVHGCNQTQRAYPAHLALPGLFERQVHLTPEAVALRCGGEAWTYRSLDSAANWLAHGLRRRGIGRGQLVAIALPRTPQLVAALLAVLKSGAAYVPLDPGFPQARLLQILASAKPALTLTDPGTRQRLPEHAETWIPAAEDWPVDAWQTHAGPAGQLRPDDLAYVIYTSGSTGRPKGVKVRHGSLANLLWSMRTSPGMSSDDALLAVTTVSFDIAALELFLPLIVGGTVVLAREADTADGRALQSLLDEHRVTLMQGTPSTWQLLLAAGWTGTPRLKMLCGGEALSRPLAERLLACGAELWNLYGPTETTIWSSAERVRLAPRSGPVCLGGPIANTQFHVLGSDGQLMPAGAIGELYIGGDGVAAGYVGLPVLTRERFVPDPFRPQAAGAGRAPALLYRTGDRVRRRGLDQLEFLGRTDHQVKLRGFRIELGEIEAVLRGAPQVGDAAVLLVRDAAGEPALQAYVVASGERAPRDPEALMEALQQHLRSQLPAYMCPGTLRLLPEMPHLPNGKTDRRALALMAASEPLRSGRGEPPQTATEKRLARLWRPVLGIVGVARRENFFEIGGHSLLAVRLLVRIEAEFGQRLALADLFQNPTLAQQAALLDEPHTRPALDFRQVVRLQPDGARQPLIAINNTGIYYGLSKHLGRQQPFTSLQLFDPADPDHRLPSTVPGIAAGYVKLIRRVQPQGPYALLGWCVAGTIAFEVAQQLRRAGEEVSHLFLFDTVVPGHLRRMPWLRARLSDYSYRWKLIAADWQRRRHGQHAVREFLAHRESIIRLRHALRGGPPPGRDPPPPVRSAEDYDAWLLRHLEAAAEAYEPVPYAGPMTLIRSAQEPAGRFIDPGMGWSEFAAGGLTVQVVDGDHFSMFQEPGVAALAQRLDATLRAAP